MVQGGGQGTGGGKTWADLVDKVAQQWSSWGWPMKTAAILGIVVATALFLFWLFRKPGPAVTVVLPSSSVAQSNDKPGIMNVNVTGPAQIGNQNVQHNVFHGPKTRTITREQVTGLATAARAFRGTRINVFQYNVGEREIADLTDALTAALKGADWAVTEVVGTEMGDKRSARPLPGLLVEVRQGTGAQAANALVDALRTMGLKIDGPLAFDAFGRGGVMSQGTEDPNAEIQLTIGRNNGP